MTDYRKHPVAIDLFAGGGGFTVGLKNAGFRVLAAVENDAHAQATFQANHPDVLALNQDIETVTGPGLLCRLDRKKIDLLVGCPPCQGFTSLTAKYRRDDRRNGLVFEMARLAREIRPRAIIFENVPRLHRQKRYYGELVGELRQQGYVVSDGVLDVVDYGVPQHRKRLVLLGGLGFRIDLPESSHSLDGANGLKSWSTVRKAIGHMGKPATLSEARRRGPLERSDWHVTRDISERNMSRLRHTKPGDTWESIPEGIRPPCHRKGYRGFSNVYGRMSWNSPAPTITGGCTTFSTGRFGHPSQNRTISVREAAALQTFPADYRINTPFIGQACKIVGNAFPCLFAEALSRHCMAEMRKRHA